MHCFATHGRSPLFLSLGRLWCCGPYEPDRVLALPRRPRRDLAWPEGAQEVDLSRVFDPALRVSEECFRTLDTHQSRSANHCRSRRSRDLYSRAERCRAQGYSPRSYSASPRGKLSICPSLGYPARRRLVPRIVLKNEGRPGRPDRRDRLNVF